jgi:hypothetical protein
MKHHDLGQWVDFVRGVVSEAGRIDMEAHLISCRQCGQMVERLRWAASTARADADREPPAPLIRWARALYGLHRPERVGRLPRLVARLLHDSQRDPIPAGVRAEDRPARQTRYQAGQFLVDLRLERQQGSPLVALVGQVSHVQGRARELRGAPVLLTSGRTILARTICNEFGEFQLEYEPRGHLRLQLPVSEPLGRIDVSLGRFADHRKPAGRLAPGRRRLGTNDV